MRSCIGNNEWEPVAAVCRVENSEFALMASNMLVNLLGKPISVARRAEGGQGKFARAAHEFRDSHREALRGLIDESIARAKKAGLTEYLGASVKICDLFDEAET